MRATASVILVLMVFPLLVAASPAKKDLVKAEALASVSTIKPGEPFKVGVRFKIEPEWHIYWINPGESGQATTVDWTFPEGYVVGPLEYPLPVNFPQPGDVKGYGYLDEVMLIATVTPPADAAPGTEVPFTAKAVWLCCSDVCIPGKATLSGKLTVASSATPANEQVFENWNKRLPAPASAKVSEGAIASTSAAMPAGAAGPVELVVKWKDQPPPKVEWFVGTPDSVMLKDEEAATDGNASKFRFMPVPVPDEAVKVPVVVAYIDASGKRQGFEFTFNLGASEAAAKGQAAGAN